MNTYTIDESRIFIWEGGQLKPSKSKLTGKYPLINKKGDVKSFGIQSAKDILNTVYSSIQTVKEGKAEDERINEKWYKEGWRNLSKSEYDAWLENPGIANIPTEQETAISRAKKIEAQDAEKSARIAELEARLKEMEMKEGVKKPKQEKKSEPVIESIIEGGTE